MTTQERLNRVLKDLQTIKEDISATIPKLTMLEEKVNMQRASRDIFQARNSLLCLHYLVEDVDKLQAVTPK
jgi:hypothetical protein